MRKPTNNDIAENLKAMSKNPPSFMGQFDYDSAINRLRNAPDKSTRDKRKNEMRKKMLRK